MQLYKALLLLAAAFMLECAAADQSLTIVSWGGAYESAQRIAIFDPYSVASGVPLEVKRYDGSLRAVQARAAPEQWDVIDMAEGQAIAGCETGLLISLDHDTLIQAESAGNGTDDFKPATLRDCSIPHTVFATVIAYDNRAFPGVKPSQVEDFFDLERFPGKRAIEKKPDAILEWALMAEGVPASQVYDLLSTDRGLRLAFRKLEVIRSAIIWWNDAGQPAKLLASGEVAMASGYNGRFFSMAASGAPISIVWDGRLIGYDVWAVLASSQNTGPALEFLRFALEPRQMSRLAEYIPYGPARQSAHARIGLNPTNGTPMRDHLPNSPQHGGRRLDQDSQWYANTQALRDRRFQRWLHEAQ